MKRWLLRLINPMVTYFLYVGLLHPFVSGESRGVVVIVGVPFAVAVAYIWGQALRLGALRRLAAPGTVQADRFIMQDASGRARAVLGITGGIPALDLYDSDGAVRVSISVGADIPGVSLYEPDTTPRAQLVLASDGPHLVLRDPDGGITAALDALAEGAKLRFYNGGPEPFYSIP